MFGPKTVQIGLETTQLSSAQLSSAQLNKDVERVKCTLVKVSQLNFDGITDESRDIVVMESLMEAVD